MKVRGVIDWQNVGRLLLLAGLQLGGIVLLTAAIFWTGVLLGEALLAGN